MMLRILAALSLFAVMASATEYRYVITGNDGDDQDEILIVDTESPDFRARVDWISERAGLVSPRKARDYMNHAPAVANANPLPGTDVPLIWGQMCWQKEGKEACVDVQRIATGDYGPMHALAWLNLSLGLGKDQDAISHLRYTPPKPPEAAKDCQAPGAPLTCDEIRAGTFSTANSGKKVGDTWTGPSGATYKLTNIGGFFYYGAWVRQ